MPRLLPYCDEGNKPMDPVEWIIRYKDDPGEYLHKKMKDREWRLSHLYYIVDADGFKVLFKPNVAQRKLIKNMWFLNVILKARQLGFSTFIDLFILDACLWNKDLHTGIIAHTKPDAEAIFDNKVKYPYDNLHEELRKLVTSRTDRAGELQFSNGSSIRVSTSFRSGTLQILHVCLSGETGIITKDGIIKKIQDICPGDIVLTSKGSYRPVKSLIINRLEDLDSTLIEIKTFGNYQPLRITDNHRVMTREKKTGKPIWKPAGEVKRGDYIAFPIREISLKSRDGLIPFGRQKWIYTDGRRSGKEGKRVAPTFSLGWLCGFYLAEGNIRSRGGRLPTDVSFAIHRDETTALVNALEEFRTLYGKPRKSGKLINVYDHDGCKTTVVTINSKDFAVFLAEKFGCGKEKHIPDTVWNLGVGFCRGLVKGYLDGDGSYQSVNEISATSIRRNLIDQMKMLLLSLRIGYPSIHHAEGGEKYGRECQEMWTLKIMGAANWKLREVFSLPMPDIPNTKASRYRVAHGARPGHKKKWRRGIRHYWSQVTGVSDCEQEEFVYDIALDVEPHDYVTTNGVVHNSEYGKISANYPDKAREIKTGAIEAVKTGQMIFVESTAEGRDGEFFMLTQRARKLEDTGQALDKLHWKFHFFSWWEKPDNVADPEKVVITSEYIKYFKDLAARGIKISEKQKAWYILKAEALIDDMKREHPSYADEAFEASIEGAYYGRAIARMRQEGRIGKVPYLSEYPVYTFWDIGVGDVTAIWFFQKVLGQGRLFDYYQKDGEGLDHFATVLAKRRYVYSTFFFPHDMRNRVLSVMGGATGAKTNAQVAAGLGMTPQTIVPRPKTTEEFSNQVEATRHFIAGCWIDEERCDFGIKALENYRKEWDSKGATFRDTPLKTWARDGADALRTGAVGFRDAVDYETEELEPEEYYD